MSDRFNSLDYGDGPLMLFKSMIQYFKNLSLTFVSLFRAFGAVFPYLTRIASREQTKEVTERYPDPVSCKTPDDLPARSRGLLWNDIDKCTGCGECQLVCPTRCISVETEISPNPTKTWVSVFDIDHSQCVFCGLCVEVCMPGSLVHTKEYELSVYQSQMMKNGFGKGRLTAEVRKKLMDQRNAEKSAGVY